MIANLPDAASARKRMQHIATNWDPNKNGQLLGEKESAPNKTCRKVVIAVEIKARYFTG